MEKVREVDDVQRFKKHGVCRLQGNRDTKAALLLLRCCRVQPAMTGTTTEWHPKENGKQPSLRLGKSLHELRCRGAQLEIQSAGTKAHIQLPSPTDSSVL